MKIKYHPLMPAIIVQIVALFVTTKPGILFVYFILLDIFLVYLFKKLK